MFEKLRIKIARFMGKYKLRILFILSGIAFIAKGIMNIVAESGGPEGSRGFYIYGVQAIIYGVIWVLLGVMSLLFGISSKALCE